MLLKQIIIEARNDSFEIIFVLLNMSSLSCGQPIVAAYTNFMLDHIKNIWHEIVVDGDK